jgi:hypothetical protein
MLPVLKANAAPHPAENVRRAIELSAAGDRPCHGAEQVLGAGDVFMGRADEVLVHHQDMFLTDRPDCQHDIRDASLPAAGPAEEHSKSRSP